MSHKNAAVSHMSKSGFGDKEFCWGAETREASPYAPTADSTMASPHLGRLFGGWVAPKKDPEPLESGLCDWLQSELQALKASRTAMGAAVPGVGSTR